MLQRQQWLVDLCWLSVFLSYTVAAAGPAQEIDVLSSHALRPQFAILLSWQQAITPPLTRDRTAHIRPLVNVAWVNTVDKCAGYQAQFLKQGFGFTQYDATIVNFCRYSPSGLLCNKLLHLRMSACRSCLRRRCKPVLRWISTVVQLIRAYARKNYMCK